MSPDAHPRIRLCAENPGRIGDLTRTAASQHPLFGARVDGGASPNSEVGSAVSRAPTKELCDWRFRTT
jgi:hypothetical protein